MFIQIIDVDYRDTALLGAGIDSLGLSDTRYDTRYISIKNDVSLTR